MTEFVGKIKRIYLAKSKFEKAKLMAGDPKKSEYKYLTQSQVDQLSRYQMFHLVQPLTKKDIANLENWNNKPKRKLIPTKVKYKDEDGEHVTNPFKSQYEAQEWVDFQESNKQTGEKFEFIEYLT